MHRTAGERLLKPRSVALNICNFGLIKAYLAVYDLVVARGYQKLRRAT